MVTPTPTMVRRPGCDSVVKCLCCTVHKAETHALTPDMHQDAVCSTEKLFVVLYAVGHKSHMSHRSAYLRQSIVLLLHKS